MVNEDAKKERRQAIAEEIIQAATDIAASFRNKLKSMRAFIKPYHRKPTKKQKALRVFNVAMRVDVARWRIFQIMSAPIPKFPKGGIYESGIASVGESGEEVILRRQGL